MKRLLLAVLFSICPMLQASDAEPAPVISEELLKTAFMGRSGAFVMIDSATGATFCSDEATCAERLAPCSTFKVWNSAIGLELGILKDPDEPFWKWDGESRTVEDWNKDQTLRSAFWVSCVPAYQDLARKIGQDRMHEWVEKLGYGDRNISAGVDIFWLPQPPDRVTLLVTPREQAEMIAKLIEGKLPISAETQTVLKSIMLIKKSEPGNFYGKTGSGDGLGKDDSFGWFVGWVEVASGRKYAFACVLKGEGMMGKDARAATETVLTGLGFL